jgi:O-succinylbenzoic acid--CoA ligase
VTEKFDAAATLNLIDAGAVSHLSLVPTMLKRLLDARGDRPFPASLKVVLLGGASIPEPLVSECQRQSLPIVCSYGLTEAASQVTATRLWDTPERQRTSGRMLADQGLQIRDENGVRLPADQVGEIWIRGKTVFRGYVGDKKASFDHDGWFATGDLGRLDDDGYLTVVGRKDEMFISGGENIYPQEIEQAALTGSGIARAACVPIADEHWGMRPLLFVEPETDAVIDVSLIRKLLLARLARFKVPEQIVVLDQLPGAAIGKVDYAQLRRMAEQLAKKRDR